jgi:Mrp family chromosome partitioning ATPase
MDHIVDAVERAKQGPAGAKQGPTARPAARERSWADLVARVRVPPPPQASSPKEPATIELEPAHLESMRIIAHDTADPRAKSFDMLRTQVLQAMATNGWRLLAITSPSAACGKTFTAINLALSIARQAESPPLLIDLDLQKSQVAKRLGLSCNTGLRRVLKGKTPLADAVVRVSIDGHGLMVLPCEKASSKSSDLLASQAAIAMLNGVRSDPTTKIAIVDLPPLLTGDDVISVLPHVDCVLLVAAAGTTTTTELKECSKYLKSTPVVRVVLNKLPEPALRYY